MSKKILTLIIVSLVIPQVTFASWWNPFTWFHKTVKTEQQVPPPSIEQKGEIKTLPTTTSSVLPTTKITPKSSGAVVPSMSQKQGAAKFDSPISMWEAGIPMRCTITKSTQGNITQYPATAWYDKSHYYKIEVQKQGTVLFTFDGVYQWGGVETTPTFNRATCIEDIYSAKTPEEKKKLNAANFQTASKTRARFIASGKSILATPGTRCEEVSAVNLTVPKEVKFVDTCYKMLGVAETPEQARDKVRISDIANIQLGLALYFDESTDYPKNLMILSPKYIPQIPIDPTMGNSYDYVVSEDGMKYSLGASLEDENNYKLQKDSDGRGGPLSTFGADTAGCHGEVGRYCYDVSQ